MSFKGGFERGGVQIEHVARRTEINSSRYKGKQEEGLHGLLGQTKTKRRRGSKAVGMALQFKHRNRIQTRFVTLYTVTTHRQLCTQDNK